MEFKKTILLFFDGMKTVTHSGQIFYYEKNDLPSYLSHVNGKQKGTFSQEITRPFPLCFNNVIQSSGESWGKE